ncbi:MAG: CBS domain-containing protein [Candidatus Hydrogenedentes bacterium]|nr:CBS domain-containing protein [Candidatus Hydrogenedentota bacterium]
MQRVPKVREIMKRTVHSLPPNMCVFEAVDFVVAKKLAGVPVIDENDTLVGFLTEKDCLRLEVVAHQYNMTGRTVRDIMSGINQGLHPDTDLLSAASAFLACNFATLPVIDGDQLVGSITRQGMLSAVQRWHRDRSQGYQQEKAAQRMVDNPSSIGQLQMLVGKSNKQQLASVLGRRHGTGRI